MNPALLISTLAASLTAVGVARADVPALDAASAARLDALQTTPALAGSRVYQGRVFAPKGNGGPLFTYERRVTLTDGGLEAAHLTRDAASGTAVILESARLSPSYALQRFESINRQQGFHGEVVASTDGRTLTYRVQRGSVVSQATERVSDPVVAGPSLHGFILQHWDTLQTGRALPVRMIVMTRQQSLRMRIRKLSQADGRSAFSITPTNWLLRLALAPLTVTFDDTTRQVVRYDGRVPPLRIEDGRAQAFDARVEYDAHALSYR